MPRPRCEWGLQEREWKPSRHVQQSERTPVGASSPGNLQSPSADGCPHPLHRLPPFEVTAARGGGVPLMHPTAGIFEGLRVMSRAHAAGNASPGCASGARCVPQTQAMVSAESSTSASCFRMGACMSCMLSGGFCNLHQVSDGNMRTGQEPAPKRNRELVHVNSAEQLPGQCSCAQQQRGKGLRGGGWVRMVMHGLSDFPEDIQSV